MSLLFFLYAWFVPDCLVLWWLLACYADRSYCGPPDFLCRYCGASFWFAECSKSGSSWTQRKMVYNRCVNALRYIFLPLRIPRPISGSSFDSMVLLVLKNSSGLYVSTIVCSLLLRWVLLLNALLVAVVGLRSSRSVVKCLIILVRWCPAVMMLLSLLSCTYMTPLMRLDIG